MRVTLHLQALVCKECARYGVDRLSTLPYFLLTRPFSRAYTVSVTRPDTYRRTHRTCAVRGCAPRGGPGPAAARGHIR